MQKLEKAALAAEGKKFGDLHIHSGHNDGSVIFDGHLTPHEIVDLAEAQGQSFVAITDHDSIVPSVVARNYAEKNGLQVHVIVGKEVSSRDGHILALGMQENIPFWMNAEETVRAIHRQKGLAIAAHPFYKLTRSLQRAGLLSVSESPDPEIYWDGFEGFNESVNNWRRPEWFVKLSDANRKARRFYKREGQDGLYGALVAGSDAHKTNIGHAVTVIPEGTDIYTAIRTRQTDIKITDEKEPLSVRSLLSTQRKSTEIEVFRRALPSEKRVFPGIQLTPQAL
jgi:predicted metal-dependent phosphoesterase TrpH